MLLVLDLLWRGYRVIVSTHAPLVLDVLFALRTLKEADASPARLCDAFGIRRDRDTLKVMESALTKSYRTFYLHFEEGHVVSQDISALNPSSANPNESGWGGLTDFSSRVNNVVAEAVNAS
jgi:hypothetical protein